MKKGCIYNLPIELLLLFIVCIINTEILPAQNSDCSGLAPTIIGTDGDDNIIGTDSIDIIVGLEGEDVIEGLGGNDIICGGEGRDTLLGSAGNDLLIGGGKDDTLSGGEGNDTLKGGDGKDLLEGNDGNDVLEGGDGSDELFGGNGRDILSAGDNNDYLDGGTGVDELDGNEGNNDECINGEIINNCDYDNAFPIANAGADQSVFTTDTVQLDGNGSSDQDGDSLSFFWQFTQKPQSSNATLSDPNIVNPTFEVDIFGEYILELTVNDSTVISTPDSVTISTQNSAPIANAGADQAISLPDTVQLDGSGSNDVDGNPITYLWKILTKPEGSTATLDDNTIVNPLFNADIQGTYVIQLVVNDGESDSSADLVVISTENIRPVADAGYDQYVNAGDTIQLDGSRSSDADDDTITYSWSFVSLPQGSTTTLTNPTSINPSFVVDAFGVYVIQLVVNDGTASSNADTILVDTYPVITIRKPDNGLITPISEQTITGFISEPVSLLTVDGQVIQTLTDSSFSYNAVLSEGLNSFAFEATDFAGLTGQTILDLTLDTIVPILSEELINTTPSANEGEFDVTGVSGSVEAGSEVSVTNIATGQAVVVTANPDGSFFTTIQANNGDLLELSAVDQAGNTSGIINIVVGSGNLPVLNPPELSTTDVAPFIEQVEFLFKGDNPVQTGVSPGTLYERTIAVIRGRVFDRLGNPLPGVNISVVDYPEFGSTQSREDGWFDMAVNGGGFLSIRYQKIGYLVSERQVELPWKDYLVVNDVVLIEPDPIVTTIDLSSQEEFQVARGSVSTDEYGSRQATILVPRDTTATMVFEDGSTKPLSIMDVRLTEYTIGDSGPQSMPAELPKTSGYTYAVELGVDQAVAGGASSIEFNKEISFYIENFLGFKEGDNVPVGYFDKELGQWIASKDGKIIEIVSVTEGFAHVDVTGDGIADVTSLIPLGITDEEAELLPHCIAPEQVFGGYRWIIFRLGTVISHMVPPSMLNFLRTGLLKGISISFQQTTKIRVRAAK